jgi:ribosomal protein L37AE/L43A
MSVKKWRIEDHIPEMDEERQCDRCDNTGSRDFVGEWLCNQCILDDVFEEMDERNN